ncbi:MAG: MFS transporter [Deltaproteobacteria bacterium]|nr:MFS transporter [Deltaproteobacteria bacterium]
MTESAKGGVRSRGPSVLAAAFVGNAAGVGLTLHVFGVFVEPVAQSLGAAMAVMALAPVLWQCINGLLNVPLGRLLGSVSIRNVMALGATLLGGGLALLSRTGTLVEAGLVYALLVSIGSVMVGTLPAMTLVSNWYEERRGRALGIVSAGTIAAGLFFPPLAAWLIELFGWQHAFLLLGLGTLVVVMPILLAFVIDRPEQVGERPDGRPASEEGELLVDPAPVEMGAVLRDRNFWLIAITFSLLFAAGLVSVLFTVPFALQIGLDLQQAAWVMSARSGAGFAGRILLTGLSDRVGRRPVLWGVVVSQILLWSVLVRTSDTRVFVVVSVAIGFTSTAFPLRAALVGAAFGRASFSRAMGLLFLAELPFQLMAAPLAGYVYDTTGDYATAFSVFLPVFFVAGILLFFIRDGPAREAPRRPL